MGLKVLLADDETEYVDTLAERLELRDYSVRVVHDGISALTAVEEDMPDVVVLDLFMPGLPGNKVLAELNLLLDQRRVVRTARHPHHGTDRRKRLRRRPGAAGLHLPDQARAVQ